MAQAGDEIENLVTGERIVFRRTATDTGGELLELEDLWTRPEHRVTEHVHPEMEERWEVLAGTVCFRIDGAERVAGPGETVIAPAGVPHMGRNCGGTLARLRIQMRPALRWEEVVETLFSLAEEGRTDEQGVPEPAALVELLREFPCELAAPPSSV